MNSRKNVLLILFIATLLCLTSFAEDESLGDGSGNGEAKYCRCKPGSGSISDCLSGNAISFRPICQRGAGDCYLGEGNC